MSASPLRLWYTVVSIESVTHRIAEHVCSEGSRMELDVTRRAGEGQRANPTMNEEYR